MLAVEVWHSRLMKTGRTAQAQACRGHGRGAKYMPQRAMLAVIAANMGCPAAASAPRCIVPMTQEEAATAFAKLYPSGIFDNFKFPMIEDLITQHPFAT